MRISALSGKKIVRISALSVKNSNLMAILTDLGKKIVRISAREAICGANALITYVKTKL